VRGAKTPLMGSPNLKARRDYLRETLELD